MFSNNCHCLLNQCYILIKFFFFFQMTSYKWNLHPPLLPLKLPHHLPLPLLHPFRTVSLLWPQDHLLVAFTLPRSPMRAHLLPTGQITLPHILHLCLMHTHLSLRISRILPCRPKPTLLPLASRNPLIFHLISPTPLWRPHQWVCLQPPLPPLPHLYPLHRRWVPHLIKEVLVPSTKLLHHLQSNSRCLRPSLYC